MQVTGYKPNKVIISTSNQGGFLVLSERYSLFNGWKAVSDKSQKEIFNAYNILTTVHLTKDDDKISFSYMPRSFIIGSSITLISLAFILFYLPIY